MTAVRPYQLLADRYDAVMAHVDYPRWARLVERIWKSAGAAPRRILETGAGTCRMASHIERPGRVVVATDVCAEMIERGFSRAKRRACCDYTSLPFQDGSFDAVLCLYDAVNYCLSASALDAFFSEAARVLEPGGTLLFDATTSHNSRVNFADVVFHDRIGGSDVIRHSWYDEEARAQHNDFTFFSPGKSGYVRTEEHHVQKVWPRTAFRGSCRRAGLEMLGCWDDGLVPAGRSALRLHMLCRRP